MIQTPSPFATEEPLDLPPAVVFNDPPPQKPKQKIPTWIIILFVIGLILSLSITGFIIASRESEAQKKKTYQQPRTIIITTTPVPVTEVPASAISTVPDAKVKLYANTDVGFSLEYPSDWETDNSDTFPTFFGASGALYIAAEDNSGLDIRSWFDEKYPEGTEGAPRLVTIYTNPKLTTLLETSVQSEKGRLKYFFKTPKNAVISVTFSTSSEEKISTARLAIYGKIVDSITPLR